MRGGLGLLGVVLLLELGMQPGWGQGRVEPGVVAQRPIETFEGKLDPNSLVRENGTYYNVHTFAGTAGQQIRIDLISDEFDSYILLNDPQGNPIEENDDGGEGTNARLVLELTETGDYQIFANTHEEGAEGAYTLVIQPATAVDLQLAEAGHLNDQVLVLHDQGRYAEAIPLAEQALSIREQALGANHPDIVISLNNLASLYESMGRYEEAEPLYLRSLSLINQLWEENPSDITNLSDLPQQALVVMDNLAQLYGFMGRFEDAELLLVGLLSTKEQLLGANHPQTAASLNDLGELYLSMGRYEEAESLFLRSFSIREQALGANHLETALSLNSLAQLYMSMGRYEEAESLLLRSRSIIEQAKGENSINTAASLATLAELYRLMGRYAEAEPLFLRSLSIREQTLGSNHPETGQSLNNLAGIYYGLGRYGEAEPLFLRAISIAEQFSGPNHPDTAQSLGNLALVYSSMGRYGEAEPLLLRVLSIVEQALGSDHPDTATSLNNLAELYRSMGHYEKAEPLFLRSLSITEQVLGVNHPDVADTLGNLAELHRSMGHYAEAEPLYLRSLSILEQTLGTNHPATARTLNNLAALYQAQANFSESLRFMEQGVQAEENILINILPSQTESEQQAYLNTISAIDDRMVSLHLQHLPNDPHAAQVALTTLLQRKGRILDTLSNSLTRLRQNLTPDDQTLLDQLTALRTQLSILYNRGSQDQPPETYRAQLETLQTQINQTEKTLAQHSAEFQVAAEPISLAAVQALIPEDATLIEFFRYKPFDATAPQGQRFGEAHYAVYLLTSQGDPIGLDLGKAQVIEQKLKDIRDRGLSDPSSPIPRLQKQSQQLYDLVFAPLEPYLTNTQHLLISPDAALSIFPFAALVNPQGQYLIENYTLTTLSTGRDLLRLQNHYTSQTPPLLVVNPDYNNWGDVAAIDLIPNPVAVVATRGQNSRSISVSTHWANLPGTAQEGQIIQAKLPQATILQGTQASEAALKRVHSPFLLHLATHGFFSSSTDPDTPQNPLLRSGLVLAGVNRLDPDNNQGEDGVLSALEVTGLDLRGTQLVVLSACETGLGAVASGEGIYGLQRAFTLAGAESQLFSLWSVSDWATQVLMVRYYDYLLAGKGRSEAWRQTQLDMLRGDLDQTFDLNQRQTLGDTAHPNYWAAFVPAGNWQPFSDLNATR